MKYVLAALILAATASTAYAECVQWAQYGNRLVCVQHRHGD